MMKIQLRWKCCLVPGALILVVGATPDSVMAQGKTLRGWVREIEKTKEEIEEKGKQALDDAEETAETASTSFQDLLADPTGYVAKAQRADLYVQFAGLLVERYGGEALPLDLAAAAGAAKHADRAYLPLDQIREQLGEGVRCGEITEALTALQYYWVREADRQVIAIRGTEPTDPRNLLADLVIDTEPDPIVGVEAHEGFLVASQIVHAALLPTLDTDVPILITGHSLGGSIATLLGLRLQVTGFDVEVITFGAPKVATVATLRSSAEVHRLPLRRFVNAGDAVPHFPVPTSSEVDRAYAHFGAEWELNPEGIQQTDLFVGLLQSVAIVTDPDMLSWSIDHHAMSSYLAQLERLAIAEQEETPVPPVAEEEAPAPKRKRGRRSIGGFKLPFGG